MNAKTFLSNYFSRFQTLVGDPAAFERIEALKDAFAATHRTGKKVIIVGNGGSAAISGHVAVDLTKAAGIRAVTFNEANLITCFSNDYGYENWVQRALEAYGDDGDLIVLISSSGKSPNMVNGARYAVSRGWNLVTLSGFAADNPLRTLGMINFWLDSREYNMVENAHQMWLLAACDLYIAEKEKAGAK